MGRPGEGLFLRKKSICLALDMSDLRFSRSISVKMLRGQLYFYPWTSEGRSRLSVEVITVLRLTGAIGVAEIAQEKIEEFEGEIEEDEPSKEQQKPLLER